MFEILIASFVSLDHKWMILEILWLCSPGRKACNIEHIKIYIMYRWGPMWFFVSSVFVFFKDNCTGAWNPSLELGREQTGVAGTWKCRKMEAFCICISNFVSFIRLYSEPLHVFLAFRFKAYLKRVLRRKVIWSCSQVSWQKRVTNNIPSLRKSRWAVCLGWFACSISAAVQNFFQMGEVRTFSNIQYWHYEMKAIASI